MRHPGRRGASRYLSLWIAAAAALTAVVPEAAAGQEQPTWVALGDSFSAGEGGFVFDDATNKSSLPWAFLSDNAPDPDYPYNACHRSPWAYPRLLAPLERDPGLVKLVARTRFAALPYRLTHVACAGATTQDILRGTKQQTLESKPQLGPGDLNLPDLSGWKTVSLHGGKGQGDRVCNRGSPANCHDYIFQGPQLRALSGETDLVTISIGGNDVGFGDVARCLALRDNFNPPCKGRFTGDDDPMKKIKTLDASLTKVYEGILAAAPNATVVVVTYPQIVPESVAPLSCVAGGTLSLFVPDDIKWVREFTTKLNEKIDSAVKAVRDATSTRIHTRDLANAFKGHELCTALPYANPVSLPPTNSFHPNSFGYIEMAALLGELLNPTGSEPGAQPVVPGTRVETALIIDSSGSMVDNDRSDNRLDAASIYLRASPGGDRVAVVDFDDTGTIVSPLAELPGSTDRVERVIRAIDSSGGTDISAALAKGCEALRASSDRSAKRMAILLTDGQDNQTGGDDCFRANSWPVFTLGFGDATDSRLRSIAANTSGQYQRVDDVAKLPCEFIRIRGRVTNAQSPPCSSQLVEPRETIRLAYDVAPRQVQASFSTTWPGSDVVMSLVSPSGRRIDRAAAGGDLVHQLGPRFELYTVRDPEPGQWRVELFGRDVRPGGEPVVFTSASVARPGQAPTATFTASETAGVAPLEVRFDATGSADADGPLAGAQWDFGDGTHAEGTAAQTHAYTAPGSYLPRLMVADGNGELAKVDGPIINVRGGASQAAQRQIFVERSSPPVPVAVLAGGTGLFVGGLLLLLIGLLRPAPSRGQRGVTSRCVCGNVLTPDMRCCDVCGRKVGPAWSDSVGGNIR